jgi:Family of unknown function (DUF6498)
VTPSLLALGLANALPIAGVLLLGWKVFPLVLLYWLENVVVGGFNVGKLLLARPQEPAYSVGKLFLIPFFIFHFGMFTLLHGVFVFALFGAKTLPRFDSLAELPAAIRAYHLGWGVLALVVSHGLSFYWNYFENGEYRRASLPILMMQPYARLVVLHLAVLFGGWIVLTLGSPLLALLVLVALKTAADVRAHQAERHRFMEPAGPS